MVQQIKRALALGVCLAGGVTLTASAATPGTWRELPNPFAPVSRSRTVPPRQGKLQRVRVVWAHKDGAETFSLLLAACLCLVALEMKVMRRSNGRRRRLASSLAGALRGGALEFVELRQTDEPIWSYAADDEDEEPQLALIPCEVNLSRYDRLAYHAPEQRLEEPEPLKVTVSYLGGGPDPDAPVRDEDLLLGVPREFIHPDRDDLWEPQEAENELEEMLSLTAGSTHRDDPGESVEEPDLT